MGNNVSLIDDMSLFMQNKALSDHVTIVNGMYPQGIPFRLAAQGLINADQADQGTASTSLPGIFIANWIPVPGVSTYATDPINEAGAMNFRELRNKNWSQSYFDIADINYYLITADSCHILYNYLGQLYKAALYVNPTNRYLPLGIMKCYGVDVNDIISNLPRLRNLVDRLKSKIALMAVPKSYRVLERHRALSATIVSDSSLTKSKYLIFLPKYIWQYDLANSKLKSIDLSSLTTYETIESATNTLMEQLLPDEEIIRLSADITNYVTNDIYTPDLIDWDSFQAPILAPNVLSSLHNADFLTYESVTGLDITQQITSNYDSKIIWNPTFTTAEIGVLMKKIVDINSDDPTQNDMISACAWKCIPKLVGNLPTSYGGTFQYQLESCGTELLCNPQLVIFNSADMSLDKIDLTTYINCLFADSPRSSTGMVIGFPRWNNSSSTKPSGRSTNMGTDFASIYYMSQFTQSPILYLTYQGESGSNFYNAVFGEMNVRHNAIELANTQLKEIHRSMLLSAFGVHNSGASQS